MILKKKLFFVENPSDSEISELYKHEMGLMFISKDEGFGLPLVEAAHYGVRIICSNISVFREIAGEYATYVDLESPVEISKDIINWLALKNAGGLPDTKQPISVSSHINTFSPFFSQRFS